MNKTSSKARINKKYKGISLEAPVKGSEDSYDFILRLTKKRGIDPVSGDKEYKVLSLEVERVAPEENKLVEIPMTRDLWEYLSQGGTLEKLSLYLRDNYKKDTYKYLRNLPALYSVLILEFISGVKLPDLFIMRNNRSEKFFLKGKPCTYTEELARVTLEGNPLLYVSTDPQDNRYWGKNIRHEFSCKLPESILKVSETLSKEQREKITEKARPLIENSFYLGMLVAYLHYQKFLENENRHLRKTIEEKLKDEAFSPLHEELRNLQTEQEELYLRNKELCQGAIDLSIEGIGRLFVDNFEEFSANYEEDNKKLLNSELEKIREEIREAFMG